VEKGPSLSLLCKANPQFLIFPTRFSETERERENGTKGNSGTDGTSFGFFRLFRYFRLLGFIPAVEQLVSMDIERLIVEITPILKTAIRQACRRYHYSPGWDEIEDLSQGIILGLIKNNYRRLRLYDQQHSLQTWLAVIARHYIYMKIQPASVRRRKYILIKEVQRRLGELDG
jgi:hypothetical protein